MDDLIDDSRGSIEPLSSPEIGSGNGKISLPTITTHAYPLNYGAIERYVNAHKEMGHDANDAGRSVA